MNINSDINTDTSSNPTDILTIPLVTPASSSCFSLHMACVIRAGWHARLWGFHVNFPFIFSPHTITAPCTMLVRFPNPLALGSGLGLQYPYRRVFFLSALPAQKKCKSDMGNGVLIGFVNISAKLMPNHKFFYSLVTALALDFFPPPDCNFFLPPIATFTV